MGDHGEGIDPRWRRVIVVGCSGSGKTEFSCRLAERLGSAHVEIDAVYWLPDWGTRDPEEFRTAMRREVMREFWVVEGNYNQVRDIVWTAGSSIVWLNYPFPLVIIRVFRRTVRRILRREALFGGNRETFLKSFFSTESILWWVVKTFRPLRRRYRTFFDSEVFPHLTRVEFRRPSEAEKFLEEQLTLNRGELR